MQSDREDFIDGKVGLIHRRLCEIRTAIGAISKDRTGKGISYQFRGVDDAVNAVSPQLNAHFVTWLPTRIEALKHDLETSNKGAAFTRCVLLVEHTLTSAEDGSRVKIYSAGESADYSDKATTQSQSVAYRISLLNGLGIPTNDPTLDPEHGEQVEAGDGFIKLWEERLKNLGLATIEQAARYLRENAHRPDVGALTDAYNQRRRELEDAAAGPPPPDDAA